MGGVVVVVAHKILVTSPEAKFLFPFLGPGLWTGTWPGLVNKPLQGLALSKRMLSESPQPPELSRDLLEALRIFKKN